LQNKLKVEYNITKFAVGSKKCVGSIVTSVIKYGVIGPLLPEIFRKT